MPKAFNSVVGIDLGRHTLKAVHLQRKNNRFVLSGYASRVVGGEAPGDADALAHHLKLLFRDLGTSGKACMAAVSSPKALIRIIDQPATPTHLLRDALRLNGLTLLNQEVRDFVLDCDLIPPSGGAPEMNGEAEISGRPKYLRYLVGGLPRAEVTQISAAFSKNRTPADRLQLAPICNYNAFEFSQADIFARESFVLVDIGHLETRVMVGAKKELVLVRTVDYGGNHFVEAVAAEGAIDRESAIMLIEQNDPGMVEAGRSSLRTLARELRSSIGFFEGQREEPVNRVYFSGGLVKALMPLQILSDELEIACNTWDPFQHCQIDLPKNKLAPFDAERTHLNVACGAALEMLRGK
jgi:Tfp pilus assembly PilM family ATPase